MPPEEWEEECGACGSFYSKKDISHLTETTIAGGHFVCFHCGGVQKNHGGPFSQVFYSIYAFRCDHTDCELNEDGKHLKELSEKEDPSSYKTMLLMKAMSY